MSSAREHILRQIRLNKPADRPLPGLEGISSHVDDIEMLFCGMLAFIGAEYLDISTISNPEEWLKARYGALATAVVLDPEFGSGNRFVESDTPIEFLNSIEVAVFPGKLGVAENGAIWLDDDSLPHRILPFIAQHLVLTLSRKDLVQDMHEAYRRISPGKTGFGVFIAGPSKTADIEQSLVKGAQGPRTATVLLR